MRDKDLYIRVYQRCQLSDFVNSKVKPTLKPIFQRSGLVISLSPLLTAGIFPCVHLKAAFKPSPGCSVDAVYGGFTPIPALSNRL